MHDKAATRPSSRSLLLPCLPRIVSPVLEFVPRTMSVIAIANKSRYGDSHLTRM